jgi:uncharacterized membrane protein YkoI
MSRYTKVSVLFVTIAAIAAGTAAYAAKQSENDAFAVTNAKVSLVQAISAAEQHVKGKASRAEYEKTKSGWAYDVEVVANGKVFDVTVNSENAAIIASTEDKEDHDDDHDKKD